MSFVDSARVFVKAGKGGDGVVSFRKEIYVDKGGPDGGDGGKGGDIIFEASEGVNTLVDFRFKPELKASDGQSGSKAKRAGRSGEDFIVKVPVGTVVTRDGVQLCDLTEHEQQYVIAKGGDGGFGNAHFKSSTRQTPRIAEKGEEGDVFEADLELKLLADVGLVGFPNAGKSTFLRTVTNATPEVADYAFTTLTPNLGVADIDDGSVLIADIPGLIEGASEGKGLGGTFLRHVERTAVLLHLIDVYSDDVAKAYETIRRELSKYSDKLSNCPEVVALTKVEGFDDELIEMQMSELRKIVPKSTEIITISSQAHIGTTDLLRKLRKIVTDVRSIAATSQEEDEETLPVITLDSKQQADAWSIEYIEDEDVYEVTGEKIEKFARRTNFDGDEDNLARLRHIMRKMGISHELTRLGATKDSKVRVGIGHSTTFPFS